MDVKQTLSSMRDYFSRAKQGVEAKINTDPHPAILADYQTELLQLGQYVDVLDAMLKQMAQAPGTSINPPST